MVTLLRAGLGVVVLLSLWGLRAEVELLRGDYLAGTASSDAEWCLAHQVFVDSRWPLAPGARALDALGRLALARGRAPLPECLPPALMASERFAAAAEARPEWPRTIALNALALAVEGCIGHQFEALYEQAQHLGPYEKGVQRISLVLVDLAWNRVEPEVRMRWLGALLDRMVASRVYGQAAWLRQRIRTLHHGGEICTAAQALGQSALCNPAEFAD